MKRLFTLIAIFCFMADLSGATEPTRPNIVLIMADDLGYGSLSCYGSQQFRTPRIDQLAQQGMRFTDYHSNGPLCSPTRAALLTGRYQQRCQWVKDEELLPVFQEQRRNNPIQRWAWGISKQELTIAELLGRNGYHTGIIGKWHLGYDVKFHPMNFGFAEFRGFMGGNVDYHTHVASHGLKELDWWKDKTLQNDEGYTTDLLTNYATEFIARNKSQPFFLYISHAAIHNPWQGRDPKQKKTPGEIYKEMISTLDESVGKITDELRKQQIDQQTLVLFCSDNGAAAPPNIAANGKLKGKKGTLYEGGQRVPLIAVWPGVIARGTTNSDPMMTMDFWPTFANVTGSAIPPEHTIDGTDMLPVFKGETMQKARVLHWSLGEQWAIRRGPWKLIGKDKKPSELYNLENDLHETTNLLASEAPLVAELLQQHLQWQADVGSK